MIRIFIVLLALASAQATPPKPLNATLTDRYGTASATATGNLVKIPPTPAIDARAI